MEQFLLVDWMWDGPVEVESGTTAVRIMARRPVWVDDPHSPEGAYGWRFGWRWQLGETIDGSSTLPEAIFKHLPECPYPEIVRLRAEGHGILPRWPTESEALAALDQAAMAWAKTEVGG